MIVTKFLLKLFIGFRQAHPIVLLHIAPLLGATRSHE
jgi:hypothetical protein